MALGPLEYAVIGFEGSHFTGEIWPEIRAIQDRGVVRLVDLVFVEKDAKHIAESIQYDWHFVIFAS